MASFECVCGKRYVIDVQEEVEAVEEDEEVEETTEEDEEEVIEIDFSDCVSKNEICELLEEKLGLPEWNENKPDELLRNLKNLDDCEINIIGVNLVPDNISSYIENVIDVLNKAEKIYDNISVKNLKNKNLLKRKGEKNLWQKLK